MSSQLKDVALQGYSEPNGTPPGMFTSINHDAFCIGRWLRQTHRTQPRDVRKSRGDTYHVNGMKVRLNYIQGCTEIERIG